MSTRDARSSGLVVKQRLAIFADTSVTAERALSLEDHEISFIFLRESGVRILVGTGFVASGLNSLYHIRGRQVFARFEKMLYLIKEPRVTDTCPPYHCPV